MKRGYRKFGHVISILASVAVAWSLAGCTVGADNMNLVRGSGKVINELRQVSGLNEVVLAMSGDLIIKQDGTEALTIEGEDNIVPLISTEVNARRLTIRILDNGSFSNTKPLRFHLSVKDLTYISATGSGNINTQGLKSDNLKLETMGSGNITASNISADSCTAVTSGSGNIVASGKANSLDVTGTGSGSYEGKDLEGKSANVTLSGSGNATVRVSDTLDASVSGSGSVRYIGDPAVTRRDSGSGEIVKVK
jgi:hypothetical protein